MGEKTVLVAHAQAAVRDRFGVALTDAHHRVLTADSAAAALSMTADAVPPVDLALLDLTLAPEPAAFVRALGAAASKPPAILVFSSSVASAADVPALAPLQVGYVNEHAATTQILPVLSPYLFPDQFNRRTSARVALGVPISYRAGQTVSGAVTLDVAKGGLGIRTLNPLPKGTAVALKFRLPGTAGEIGASGHVAWSDRRVGMGVQFEEVSANDQRAIDAFVDAHV